MLKTMAMTGDWIELKITSWTEIEKLSNRIQEKNCFLDGAGALFDGICISAWTENENPILLSDYTEDKQEVTETSADYIELSPWSTIMLPRNRTFSALNNPLVMGDEGDVITIVAR